ncbi:MAG: hypothetical protein ACFHU9_14535 [Fluviicola sp.]
MKNLLIIPTFLFATLFVFAGENPGKDDSYKDAAKEMCNCVNQSLGTLSDRMINIIVSADGDEEFMGEEMAKYVEEDFEAAMLDVEALQGPAIDDMTSCFNRVGDAYEDLQGNDSEEEAQTKLLEAMEGLEGCETSLAFFRLGISSEEEGSAEQASNNARPMPPAPERVDDIYMEVSEQVCSCIGGSTDPLSERMIDIFIEANGDQMAFQELIANYASEDPDGAMVDADLLQGTVASDVDKCMLRIESDYDSLYESTPEDEIEENLIAILEGREGCEISVSVLKLAATSE